MITSQSMKNFTAQANEHNLQVHQPAPQKRPKRWKSLVFFRKVSPAAVSNPRKQAMDGQLYCEAHVPHSPVSPENEEKVTVRSFTACTFVYFCFLEMYQSWKSIDV